MASEGGGSDPITQLQTLVYLSHSQPPNLSTPNLFKRTFYNG